MKSVGEENPGFRLEEGVVGQYLEIQLDRQHSLEKETEDQKPAGLLSRDEDGFEDDVESPGNPVGKAVERVWGLGRGLAAKQRGPLKVVALVSGALLYNTYLALAVWRATTNTRPGCGLDWCDGAGFLLILTLLVYTSLLYYQVILPVCARLPALPPVKLPRLAGRLAALAAAAAVSIFLLVDTREEPRRLVSALGVLVLVLLGFLFSRHPAQVRWRHVAWGLALQFCFGLLILRWQVGQAVFGCLGRKVKTFLDFTDAGSGFVFGFLVTQQPFNTASLENGTAAKQVAETINAGGALNFVFMFKVLSIIYFFNFMVSILFYLGVMRWLVVKLGWLLQVTVGTTACESMNAAGNIFLGQTEAPLLIKPYLPDLTRSELHAVMTGGFATIAGSVLAAYISFGISAAHLLSASVMSAPAALAYAKLFYPETQLSRTKAGALAPAKSEDSNVLDAAANGASQSVFLVGNIAGSLIAFLAFVAFLNGVLGWCGGLVGLPFLSFEWLLGWIFYPLAFIMGVPCGEPEPGCQDQCRQVAILVGLKTIVNEFAAYDKLAQFRGCLSHRSQAIATYALCGFSNPASIGVQVAALTFMAPARRAAISQVAFRAFVAGSAACFLTACVAGTLIPDCGLDGCPDQLTVPSGLDCAAAER